MTEITIPIWAVIGTIVLCLMVGAALASMVVAMLAVGGRADKLEEGGETSCGLGYHYFRTGDNQCDCAAMQLKFSYIPDDRALTPQEAAQASAMADYEMGFKSVALEQARRGRP